MDADRKYLVLRMLLLALEEIRAETNLLKLAGPPLFAGKKAAEDFKEKMKSKAKKAIRNKIVSLTKQCGGKLKISDEEVLVLLKMNLKDIFEV